MLGYSLALAANIRIFQLFVKSTFDKNFKRNEKGTAAFIFAKGTGAQRNKERKIEE